MGKLIHSDCFINVSVFNWDVAECGGAALISDNMNITHRGKYEGLSWLTGGTI